MNKLKNLILIGFFILCSPLAFAEMYCNFVANLDTTQINNLNMVYNKAKKYDLQLTSVAIAWQESRLGRYMVRYGRDEYDRSYGIGHTVAKWKFIEDERGEQHMLSAFDRGMWVQRMIFDVDYSIDIMVDDILHWQSISSSWFDGVAKYNSGTYVTDSGKAYARDIVSVIKELKNCELPVDLGDN